MNTFIPEIIETFIVVEVSPIKILVFVQWMNIVEHWRFFLTTRPNLCCNDNEALFTAQCLLRDCSLQFHRFCS